MLPLGNKKDLDKMKIVCISDNHGQPMEDIPDGDILIHAGDISSDGSLRSVKHHVRELAQNPHKDIILVGGNHDWALQQELSYIEELIPSEVIILESSSVIVQGVKVWGTPVQPEFCDWAFNYPPDYRKKCYDAIPDDIDVLITHAPPYGILDKNISGVECGCKHLLNAVSRVKPKLHVFGHIHEAYGQFVSDNTTFINASLVNEHYISLNKPIIFDL